MSSEIVSVSAARTHLSRLLKRAEAGEEIVIGRAGKPIAKLVPFVPEHRKRVFGRIKSPIVVHGDFDTDKEEIAREIEESLDKPLEP